MIQSDAVPKTSPTQPPATIVMMTNARMIPTVERKIPGSVLSLNALVIRSDMVSLVFTFQVERAGPVSRESLTRLTRQLQYAKLCTTKTFPAP